MVGQAKAFPRTVFEGPLDLIMAAHGKHSVNVAVTSIKRVVARAAYGVTMTCELSVRWILNESCIEA